MTQTSKRTLTIMLITLATLAHMTLASNAEAIETVMDNINDPNHPDSKLGITEEDVLEADRTNGEPFNIRDIEKELRTLRKRWNTVKDSADLTDEEKNVIKEHLASLEKWQERHETIHEELNSLISDIHGVEAVVKQAEMNKDL